MPLKIVLDDIKKGKILACSTCGKLYYSLDKVLDCEVRHNMLPEWKRKPLKKEEEK